jgi:hypothetical protein
MPSQMVQLLCSRVGVDFGVEAEVEGDQEAEDIGIEAEGDAEATETSEEGCSSDGHPHRAEDNTILIRNLGKPRRTSVSSVTRKITSYTTALP